MVAAKIEQARGFLAVSDRIGAKLIERGKIKGEGRGAAHSEERPRRTEPSRLSVVGSTPNAAWQCSKARRL